METEADMAAEPDGMEMGMEGIVAERSATVTDLEVGLENAVGGTQSDAMETENMNVTVEGSGGAEFAAPAG